MKPTSSIKNFIIISLLKKGFVYVDNATFLSMSKAKDILDERQCTVHNYKSQLQYFN